MSYVGRVGGKLRIMPMHDDVTSMSGLSLSSQSDVEREKQAKKCKRQVTFNGSKSNGNKDRYNDRRGLQSCLVTRVKNRLPAGAGDQLTEVPSECSKAAPGIDYMLTPHTEVNFSEVRISDSVPLNKRPINKCSYFPKFEDTRKVKTVGTQTLYRESSAQTLPYLPDIQDRERDETLELFNLSKLLAGDKPPGLYEVEILERARKRWAFTKSLKTQLKQKFREAREQTYKSKYRYVIEAFEWEKWIEREEYIQECQMMRLEFVIRMFDKREQEMHLASKTRIEMACEKIEARRAATLHKNEVEYHRAMRRLQNKYNNVKHSWRKQRITYELGSPCSEFYAPLVRHGVDPGRRHFTGGRRVFDMRIDELEKKVDINKLTCPFSKLKKWSQPKEPTKEYEQNFCTDSNLQKLYETLRTLRTQATKHKQAPKCLVRRQQQPENAASVKAKEDTREDIADIVEPPPITYTNERESIEKRETILEQQVHQVDKSQIFLAERRQEDFENMLAAYEGTTIGWIMQFLSEEMERLREQRKLHFFSILAQKERWRREAAEAGLRQKENDMRYIYEELFQLSDVANVDVCNEYLNGILSTDMAHNADWDATISIESLAKQIDQDLQRWLDSFKLIQTPLTFEPLRYMLRDLVFPDLNDIIYKREKTLIVKYIIDEVLFPRIDALLDSYDVSTTITNEMIDRLIDNDLYYFSTEDESEHAGDQISHYEVEAILRKLIRQSVPGRRWRTEDERVCDENVNDIFDDIFDLIANRQALASVCSPYDPMEVHKVHSKFTIDEDTASDDIERRNRESLPQGDSELLRMRVLSLLKRMKVDKITKPLFNEEIFVDDDGFKDTDADELLRTETYRSKSIVMSDVVTKVPVVYNIPSTLDIQEIKNFRDFIEFRRQENKQYRMRTSSILSEIGIIFEKRKQPEPEEIDSETQTYQKDLLLGILDDMLPSEEGIVEEDMSQENASKEVDRSMPEEQQEEGDEHLRQSFSWERRLTGVIPAIMAHQDDDARSSINLMDKRDQSVKYAKLEDIKQRRRTWPSAASASLTQASVAPQEESIDIEKEDKTLQPTENNQFNDLYISSENLLFKAIPIKSKLSLVSIKSGTKTAELDREQPPTETLTEKDASEAPVAEISLIESPSPEAADAKIENAELPSPTPLGPIEPTPVEESAQPIIHTTEISTIELPAQEASMTKINPDDLPTTEAINIEPLPVEVPAQELLPTEISPENRPSPEATAIEPSTLEVPTQEIHAAETSPVDMLPQEVTAAQISTVDLLPEEAIAIEPSAVDMPTQETPITEISPDDLPSPEAATIEPPLVEEPAQPVPATAISTVELPDQETNGDEL